MIKSLSALVENLTRDWLCNQRAYKEEELTASKMFLVYTLAEGNQSLQEDFSKFTKEECDPKWTLDKKNKTGVQSAKKNQDQTLSWTSAG